MFLMTYISFQRIHNRYDKFFVNTYMQTWYYNYYFLALCVPLPGKGLPQIFPP